MNLIDLIDHIVDAHTAAKERKERAAEREEREAQRKFEQAARRAAERAEARNAGRSVWARLEEWTIGAVGTLITANIKFWKGVAKACVVIFVLFVVYFFLSEVTETVERNNPELVVPIMFGLTALFIVAVVAIFGLVLSYWARVEEAEADKLQAEATERILKEPLETFAENDPELDDLEKKYADGAQGGKKARKGPRGDRFCMKCGAKLEVEGQLYCPYCGSKVGKRSR